MGAKYNGKRIRAYRDNLPRAADRIAERTAETLKARTSERIVQVGAVDTGELRDSPEITERSPGRRVVTVQAKHGYFANYGTVFQPARPFWEPALGDAAEAMVAIAREELRG